MPSCWFPRTTPPLPSTNCAKRSTSPERTDIHYSLAIALNSGGNPAAAVEHYRKAAELDPQSPVYQVAMEGL